MTLAETLRRLTLALEDVAVDEARIEAEVLLRRHTGLTRAQILTRGNDPVEPGVEAAVQGSLQRRLRGEPLAYITGHREFFGLDFAVDHRVLIPRPETELLVETALAWVGAALVAAQAGDVTPGRDPVNPADQGNRRPVTFADIGTGSGAIAVSLTVHHPGLCGYAVDVSAEALAVARHNARSHGVDGRIVFLQGDLAAPLPEPVDVLLANLPYLRQDQLPVWCGAAQVELAWEPLAALDGGPDGLDAVRRLLADAPRRLRPGGLMLFEIGSEQGAAALRLAAAAFPQAVVTLRRDLAGLPRMLSVAAP